MLNMNIREYIDADWESVCEVYHLSKFDETGESVDFSSVVSIEDDPKALRLFEHSDIIVMEIEGRVVAFAGNRNNHISWLYVHPDYRRKGIARKLLAKILEGLSGTVTLNAAVCNPAARSLYESMGLTLERICIADSHDDMRQAMFLLLENKRTSGLTVYDYFWRAIHGEDE